MLPLNKTVFLVQVSKLLVPINNGLRLIPLGRRGVV